MAALLTILQPTNTADCHVISHFIFANSSQNMPKKRCFEKGYTLKCHFLITTVHVQGIQSKSIQFAMQLHPAELCSDNYVNKVMTKGSLNTVQPTDAILTNASRFLTEHVSV